MKHVSNEVPPLRWFQPDEARAREVEMEAFSWNYSKEKKVKF
ncbi:hypothetical protein [Mechercharimyces sp. CAU 1602]|nr:hypothetical protein [Mechercharimyces sp. CAU 1602]MCS1351407.1 hypothetical protein [Mechercharimyces sp. CAU 1602]